MSAVATKSKSLAPAQGEEYAEFVRRAHSDLMQSVPDWEERNSRVWQAWERQHGNTTRNRAMKYHAKGCARFVPDVCYFMEHETIGRDGKPVRYAFDELKDITDEQNARAEHHNYSAIADRHTSDKPLPKDQEPEVVGYTGAARLGMVGGKWAIFMDEHHKKDGLAVLNKKQRRSVEINRYRDGRRPYLDPIAALGADSPRLPLPVARYSNDESDEIIDRYECEAPAMVSGSNSFIPVLGKKRDEEKQTYSSDSTEPSAMVIGEQDVDAIIQGLMSTPEMQWVKSQMTQGAPQSQAPGSNAQTPGAPAAPASPIPAGHAAGTSPMPPQPHGAPMGGNPMAQKPQNQQYDNSDEAMVERYNALSEQYDELNDKYSQVHEANKDLITRLATTQSAVVNLERRAVDAERSERIRELYQAHPHFVVVEEELDRCLYSRGAEMDHEGFEAHVEQVATYAKRSSPVTKMVPGGALPAEKYSAGKEFGERCVELYTAYADRGIVKKYDEIEAEVKKEQAGQVA